MSEIPNGSKVRVSYEGTMFSTSPIGTRLIQGPDGRCHAYAPVDSIRIEVIEPGYESGKFYQDATGSVYFRRRATSGWIVAMSGDRVSHECPTRPLVKLVPDTTSNPGTEPAGDCTGLT